LPTLNNPRLTLLQDDLSPLRTLYKSSLASSVLPSIAWRWRVPLRRTPRRCQRRRSARCTSGDHSRCGHNFRGHPTPLDRTCSCVGPSQYGGLVTITEIDLVSIHGSSSRTSPWRMSNSLNAYHLPFDLYRTLSRSRSPQPGRSGFPPAPGAPTPAKRRRQH